MLYCIYIIIHFEYSTCQPRQSVVVTHPGTRSLSVEVRSVLFWLLFQGICCQVYYLP